MKEEVNIKDMKEEVNIKDMKEEANIKNIKNMKGNTKDIKEIIKDMNIDKKEIIEEKIEGNTGQLLKRKDMEGKKGDMEGKREDMEENKEVEEEKEGLEDL